MSILVTGVAGFIGFSVAKALLARGEEVIGIDIVNDYYSVALKRTRLGILNENPSFRHYEIDISDASAVNEVFARHQNIGGVIHLAAQAGVRYSLINPFAYIQANVMGHLVMLEAVRAMTKSVPFVYASSSSVYGKNVKQPFSVDDPVDDPISLYAVTKRSCELTSASYSHLFGITAVGLRFFTVYGPWGRPDMAAYLFADAIAAGKPIKVFNYGEMGRDFTYIDDIVAGTIAALDKPAPNGELHRVYNLGNNKPERLSYFIELIERELGRKAERELLPLQPGDVPSTSADIAAAQRDLDFDPKTPIEIGVPNFIAWYKQYHASKSSSSSSSS